MEQPPPTHLEDPCAASTVCEMTIEEMAARGLASPAEVADHYAELEAVIQEIGDAPEGASAAVVERRYGWFNFNLHYEHNCRPETVKDNGHCGWGHHKYAYYRDGQYIQTYLTEWPARSGNNKPADRWVRNVGPIPNDHSGNPGHQWRWGWMNQAFTGYESDTRESFYPGKWRLDPWVATRVGGGTSRSAFEIHGGRHTREFARTAGCVRLKSGHIPYLKTYWDHKTDNKGDFPGPKMFVNVYA